MEQQDSKKVMDKFVNEIIKEEGECSASYLVEKAKDESSPVHNHFEWDDTICGIEYRLTQARKYLRVVVVNVEGYEEKLVHIPPPIDSDKREGTYKTLTVTVKTPDEFERALEECGKRFRSARFAVVQLQKAAQESDAPDRAAIVAQIARGLDLLEEAITQAIH
jgi:hypothetical protein